MKNNNDKQSDKSKFVFDELSKLIAAPVTELEYSSTFELLVAVILSAQCTDKRVNIITKDLFKKYNTPKDFCEIEQDELEQIIHSCGFFRNKAKNIISASRDIVNKFGGQVPNNLDDLMSLSGVGRKTANVVLAVAFEIPTIPVDTHVFRVTNRIGLVKSTNPFSTEKQLAEIYDKKHWNKLHHLFILFGRYYCTARNPKCNDCVLSSVCYYYKNKYREG